METRFLGRIWLQGAGTGFRRRYLRRQGPAVQRMGQKLTLRAGEGANDVGASRHHLIRVTDQALSGTDSYTVVR